MNKPKNPQSLSLGPIPFRCYGSPESRNRFIWVHGDETTAREIILDLAQAGERCFLIENTRRNLSVDGVQLNPNRVFSTTGTAANLRHLNPDVPMSDLEPILTALDRDRESFLHEIFPRDGGVLVALHNNMESYTITSELQHSKAVYQPEKHRPRDFYITVNESDFQRLTQGPFNVVLQNESGEDDGSLSWAAQAAGVRYVNIETELGMGKRQQSMVDWLFKALI